MNVGEIRASPMRASCSRAWTWAPGRAGRVRPVGGSATGVRCESRSLNDSSIERTASAAFFAASSADPSRRSPR